MHPKSLKEDTVLGAIFQESCNICMSVLINLMTFGDSS